MKKFICYAFIIMLGSSCSAQADNTVRNWQVKMIPDNEPGKPLTLLLSVLDIDTRKPIKDVKVFAYQTNSKGDYENDSKGVARIHATAYTNDQGNVEFNTIYPRGYQDSDNGEHIHFRMNAAGYNVDSPTLDFDAATTDKNITANRVYIRNSSEKNSRLEMHAVIYLKKK